MIKYLEAEVPPDMDLPETERSLNTLLSSSARVTLEYRSQSPSDQLQQIDSTTIQIVIELLDTQATAALVDSAVGAVIGYFYAKSGKSPRQK